MTLDEAIKRCEEIASNAYVHEGIMVVNQIIKHNPRAKYQEELINECKECAEEHRQLAEWLKELKRLKEQESCEMTVEEYRQRMIQAFHNADCDELIAICALPTEKEFEHLEWLLKNHYKKEPCEDVVSREELDKALYERFHEEDSPNNITEVPLGAVRNFIKSFPPINTQEPKSDTLDKIRAEIEGVIQEETIIDRSGGEYERTISKVDPDDVLQIIDKYRKKVESEVVDDVLEQEPKMEEVEEA